MSLTCRICVGLLSNMCLFGIKMTSNYRGAIMILTIGGIKGGAGKSLTAINLVVLRSQAKKVLLVDADEQGTASDWVDHRMSLDIPTNWTTIRLRAAAVRTEVLKLSQDYDDVIIDCGGRDTASLRAALTISDAFLIPFQPKSFDIWTASKVSDLINDAKALNDKLQALTFVNCAYPRGADNEDAKEILSQIKELNLLSMTIGLRKSFSNATAEGLGVVEAKILDKKAAQEIKTLYAAVFNDQVTSERHDKAVTMASKKHQLGVSIQTS